MNCLSLRFLGKLLVWFSLHRTWPFFFSSIFFFYEASLCILTIYQTVRSQIVIRTTCWLSAHLQRASERERKSDSDKNEMHSLWINCELFYQSSSGIVITVSTTILPEWNFSIRTICFWTSQLLWITSIHKKAADFSYAVEFINNFFFLAGISSAHLSKANKKILLQVLSFFSFQETEDFDKGKHIM